MALSEVWPFTLPAPTLLIEPHDHDQPIHMVPVNGLIIILRFYGYWVVLVLELFGWILQLEAGYSDFGPVCD